MDNFMDKLAQKLSAQEMIKANAAAEAAETERLRIQTAQYQTEMEEIRKNAEETADRIRCLEEMMQQKMAESSDSGTKDTLDQMEKRLTEKLDEADANTHDVGVRVYRNVQASLQDEEKKQTQAISDLVRESTDQLAGGNDQLVETLRKSAASSAEQLKEIKEQIEALQIAVERKNSAVLPVAIMTFLAAAAGLVLIVLQICGIL
ncbi:MAG: hypothetical protein LKF52_11835 [Butyrivibrio sp.]|nr:hypothetical protein [Butyrivibrio sp.]